MANKRTFKKDISLILELVYEECLFTREFNIEKAEQIDALLEEAIEQYHIATSVRKNDPNMSFKVFYTSLIENYYNNMLEILSKLEEIRK